VYGSLTTCTHARKHSATGLVYKSVKRGGEEAARPKLRAQLLDMSILYLGGEEEAAERKAGERGVSREVGQEESKCAPADPGEGGEGGKAGEQEAARLKLRAQLLDMSILYLNGEEEAQSSSQQGSGTKDFFWMAQNSQSKPYPFA